MFECPKEHRHWNCKQWKSGWKGKHCGPANQNRYALDLAVMGETISVLACLLSKAQHWFFWSKLSMVNAVFTQDILPDAILPFFLL